MKRSLFVWPRLFVWSCLLVWPRLFVWPRRRVWCLLVSTAAVCVGCSRTSPAPQLDRPQAERLIRAGRIQLGSPHLTAGIPGEGPLSLAEIEQWLQDPAVHEPLDFSLPRSLAADRHQVHVPADNPLTWAKIELGRQLFFDKRLSGLGTFACATCHRPEQYFSSYHVMPEVGRNASTVLNRILSTAQFWEGRARSLEEQPHSPIKNAFEMNSSPEEATARIAAIPGYRRQFAAIFGELCFATIAQALASFQRALVTGDSDWDRQTLSPTAQRGEQLFFSDRLGCSQCHHGRNLTDESYHPLGVPPLGGHHDLGRFLVTGNDEHRGAFKTPSLRNVAKTPPYMHNGVFGTLEEVIDFFDRGGGNSEPTSPLLSPLDLTTTEKAELLAFLNALTSDPPPVATGRLPQ